MVSQWMENGHLLRYLKKHPGANRLELVSLTRDDPLLRSRVRS